MDPIAVKAYLFCANSSNLVVIFAGAKRGVCPLAHAETPDAKAERNEDEEAALPTSTPG